MMRTFVIRLEAETPFSADRIAKEIERLFSAAKAHVVEVGGQS